MKRVFLLQKKAIRIMNNLRQRESCKYHFKKEQILTVPATYVLHNIKYVHTHVGQLKKNDVFHNKNTRNASLLRVPCHRLTVTQQNVHYWGAKLYNKIPDCWKKTTLKELESKLKTFLLTIVPYTVEDFLCSEIQ